ncbi:MAG: hypothetical protein G01um101444_211 [Parcubacteria group bacterium Gr01-1014_44]|nr:MAG: hypothetical protein G01um101444_211 [Parcubacteria group bacterium Gr01-1014_44]
MKKAVFGIVLFILILGVYLLRRPDAEILSGDLGFLNTPDGFKISVAAKDLDGPRVIIFDSAGRMLVSETKAGRVSILEDVDKNGNFENQITLIENLKSPHGLDFYTDPKTKTTYLYIAETHQVARYPYDVKTGKITDKTGQNIANLPADGQHFTRTISFGPNFRASAIVGGSIDTLAETKLYISVGSSCDVCEETTWKRAAILETDPEGTYTAEFAGGLRNSVFFAFHPITKEIWATEMGRDNLGDNLPPDEINIVKVAGPEDKFGAKRYGWPFCYGKKIQDKKFNPEKWERIDLTNDCHNTKEPVIEMQAHSAPLGLAFIPSGKGWPKDWEGDLLVALHGSWNRSEPVGYKIVRYDLDAKGKVLSSEPKDFVSGGRPVDLKFGLDGVLYVSDDAAGLIYRISIN